MVAIIDLAAQAPHRLRPLSSNVRPHMHLESNANSLELRIRGYQFPNNSSDEYDLNCLDIEVKVSTSGKAWAFCDPCLLTWEVGALIEYLEAFARGTATPRGIGFTEPNLEFAPAGSTNLRVLFSLEASPPWLRSEPVQDNAFHIEFSVPSRQLLEAAASLRQQLAEFPGRAGRHAFKG